MKTLKDLRTGDYLYFYRDNDYSLEDVEKCKVTIDSSEIFTYLGFGWGFISIIVELVANDTKVTINVNDKPYHFYVSPPPKPHYKKNIKRRMKELEKELQKLKIAKLALTLIK